MRKDMGKVLVERPRSGRWRGDSRPGKGTQKELRKKMLTWDSVPGHEGMKRRHGKHHKHFNEHLGPLRRFLDASVGRPWDKVYSEVCAQVDRGNTVQKHVLTHLEQYVVTKTVLIDGRPCCAERRRGFDYGDPVHVTQMQHQWYVCPKSGLLRRSKCVPYRYHKPPAPQVVRLNGKSACVCRGGKWELVSVELSVRGERWAPPAYDVVLQGLIDNAGPAGEWLADLGGKRYRAARRFLTREELRGLPIPVEWLR